MRCLPPLHMLSQVQLLAIYIYLCLALFFAIVRHVDPDFDTKCANLNASSVCTINVRTFTPLAQDHTLHSRIRTHKMCTHIYRHLLWVAKSGRAQREQTTHVCVWKRSCPILWTRAILAGSLQKSDMLLWVRWLSVELPHTLFR